MHGFVTDASSGRAIELANVAVLREDMEPRGTTTDADGVYQITGLAPGRYEVRASFVGYVRFSVVVSLSPGEVRTLNVALEPGTVELDEVFVRGARLDGMARITAGHQTIRPEDVELIPTPDVSGDLVNYLTTLPGVVSTGDRGGQLFIRGGEPSQNLVLLDGMLVYQPFHLLGFYSVIPSSVMSRADVYAGGFGSRFGERMSAVIDVTARGGNKRRWTGETGLSPFMTTALVEGPLLQERVSFLASVRRSLVEQAAEWYVGERLPFRFGDAFAKLHAEVGPRNRMSVSALRSYDRGTIHEGNVQEPSEEIRWRNEAVGFRWLALPRLLSMSADLRISYSRLQSELGTSMEPSRTTRIGSFSAALDATFRGEQVQTNAGWSARFITPDSDLGGLYQNVELRTESIAHIALYAEPEFAFGKLLVRPGVRLEFYHLRLDPVVEPRLRIVWKHGMHQLSGAGGLYHQEIVGLVDQRDAASVFTVWSIVPKYIRQAELEADRIPRALHAVLGYGLTATSGIQLSIEGFYKRFDHLYVGEWTPYPRMTTRLQPATGRAAGFDTRVELRRPPFYGFINYGVSSTRYRARQAQLPLWFGEDEITYRPAHDRRHGLNVLANVRLYGFDASVRWEFGSGLPFSRPLGFDGFVLLDNVDVGLEAERRRRALYARPFDAVLPTYHRLDVSLERTFRLGAGRLTAMASLINVYDRRNIFYVDAFTLNRVDQLPLVPSLGMKITFGEE